VLELVNSKVEGKEITAVGPQVQRAQVIDLMEALKESLAKRVPAAAAPSEKKPPAKIARRAEAKAEPTPARKAQAGRK
jgi:DNA end-binding protein Ku